MMALSLLALIRQTYTPRHTKNEGAQVVNSKSSEALSFRAPELLEPQTKNSTSNNRSGSFSDLYSIALTILKLCRPDFKRSFLEQVLEEISAEFPLFHTVITSLLHNNPDVRGQAFNRLEGEVNRKSPYNIILHRDKFFKYIQSKKLESLNEENSLTYIFTLKNLCLLEEAKDVTEYFINEATSQNNSINLAQLRYAKGLCLLDSGYYIKSLEEFEAAYNIYAEEKKKETLEVARIFNSAGKAYKGLGRYTEAYDILKKALQIKFNIYGDQHAELAVDYHSIGKVLCSQGKLVESEDSLNKAYKMKKASVGESHYEIADIIESLGNVYKNKGKHDLALNLFNKSLVLKNEHDETLHSDVGRTYHNIGSLFEAQGKYEMALKNL